VDRVENDRSISEAEVNFASRREPAIAGFCDNGRVSTRESPPPEWLEHWGRCREMQRARRRPARRQEAMNTALTATATGMPTNVGLALTRRSAAVDVPMTENGSPTTASRARCSRSLVRRLSVSYSAVVRCATRHVLSSSPRRTSSVSHRSVVSRASLESAHRHLLPPGVDRMNYE